MGLGVLFLNLYRWLNDLRFYGFGFPLALSAVCSILIASAHIWRVRNVENSSKNGIVDYSVRQTLELNIPKTPQQLFDELRDALRMREWELAD